MRCLTWPPEWNAPSPLQKALMGMPILGLDRRLYAQFRRQVGARGQECLAIWPQDNPTQAVRLSVSSIIQREMRWPNRFFLPDDPCAILFFDPFSNMDSVRAILEVERAHGKKSVIERLKDVTLGTLVAEILEPQAHQS